MTPSLDDARALDRADPLAPLREEFHLPLGPDGAPAIYLCGNSLGLQPKGVRAYLDEVTDAWAKGGVEGHFTPPSPWMPYHEFVTPGLARLVGAEDSEVVAMNTLTTNLHLMMVSFFRPSGARRRVLIERPAFPSDRYAVTSQLRFHGLDPDRDLIELAPREGEAVIDDDAIDAAISEAGDTLALVLLSGVQYYSGQRFDLRRVALRAHDVGALAGFDLAHAVGNVPLALHDWGADFAVWCHYKYVNAGPGAVAGCFVHARHGSDFTLPRFAGWWGHDKSTRFKMGPDFVPLAGAEGWQLSNPPILSLAPVRASLALYDRAGMTALREKSLALTGRLEALLSARCPGVEVLTPREPERRGCQLSLRVPGGRSVHERLERAGVVCDWREPDVIRVAPVPLYNRFEDVDRFVDRLAEAITEREARP
ncbi:MAG: kynureninase [Polyangiales bacterium]